MTNPFFNPSKEFLKALWKVIAVFAIAAVFVCVCSSCRTHKSVQTEYVEVHHYDTVRIEQRDTVRVQVQNEAGNTELEEAVQRIVTIYDTLGRVRTVVQEDKFSRLVAAYYRQQYDSLQIAYRLLQQASQADSLMQKHQEEPVKVETWRDRVPWVISFVSLFFVLITLAAGGLAKMLRGRSS